MSEKLGNKCSCKTSDRHSSFVELGCAIPVSGGAQAYLAYAVGLISLTTGHRLINAVRTTSLLPVHMGCRLVPEAGEYGYHLPHLWVSRRPQSDDPLCSA